jgi:UDPglucose 6-dehydrogenase
MIGFVGLSHLGIVTSTCFAYKGEKILGIDYSSDGLDQLKRGKLPIFEPGLEEIFQENQSRLEYSSDFNRLRECQLVFFSLDTETDEENESSIGSLEKLINEALPHIQRGTPFICMSQVPVGFTRKLSKRFEERGIPLYTWVETLIIGNAVQRLLKPERIIIGKHCAKEHLPTGLRHILGYFQCPKLEMVYESAELTKMAINFYLSLGVTFANTLADLCEETGASMREIVPALRLDRRIGSCAYVTPSLGIAGGNLERDLVNLRNLGRETKVGTPLIDTILEQNKVRFQWVLNQLEKRVMSKITNPKIAIWGISYKKNTEVTKNSFTIKMLEALRGRAQIYVYDPKAVLPEEYRDCATQLRDKKECLKGADALLVMNDWDEFKEVNCRQVENLMKNPILIDCGKALICEREHLSHTEHVFIGN